MTTQSVSQLVLKLYKGEVLTTEHRDLLFSFMQNTETENRISPAIPTGVVFYHKTGSYEGGIHDAALVIHPRNPFILIIFTNDLTGLAHSTRFTSMQSAAKAVYEYFNSIN
jgi:beta-lactamase class A